PFVAMNLGACGLGLWLWYRLLYRAGFARSEAVLAASIWALSPPLHELIRWAASFQHLLVMPVLFGIVALTDAAAHTPAENPRRRMGLLLLALSLSGAGVFVKYPLMALVPTTCWLWV